MNTLGDLKKRGFHGRMTEISLNIVVDVRLRDDDNGDFFLSGSSSKRAVLCGVAADCTTHDDGRPPQPYFFIFPSLSLCDLSF